jgi:hypothetical protein
MAVFENEDVADTLIDLFEQWKTAEGDGWEKIEGTMRQAITDAGAAFVAASKEPFGCSMTVGSNTYMLDVNDQSYSITNL